MRTRGRGQGQGNICLGHGREHLSKVGQLAEQTRWGEMTQDSYSNGGKNVTIHFERFLMNA